MNEVLTAAQIETQFESEWVLVEDPETDDALGVQRGKVRWHSHTGKIPKDAAVVL